MFPILFLFVKNILERNKLLPLIKNKNKMSTIINKKRSPSLAPRNPVWLDRPGPWLQGLPQIWFRSSSQRALPADEQPAMAGPPRLARPPRPGPCLNVGFQYPLIRNNLSKKFAVEYWALPGPNSPWRPWMAIHHVCSNPTTVFFNLKAYRPRYVLSYLEYLESRYLDWGHKSLLNKKIQISIKV